MTRDPERAPVLEVLAVEGYRSLRLGGTEVADQPSLERPPWHWPSR